MEYSLIFQEIDRETYDLIRRLRSPHLKNLAWYLSAASLPLTDDLKAPLHYYDEWVYRDWDWFECQDQNPKLISGFLEEHQKNYRLGFYAENLLLYWFSENSQFNLLEAGTQIVKNGQTLTEIDFFFKDEVAGDYHFWETSLKFYLLDQFSHQWIGPGSKDKAINKLKKVNELQLPQGENYLRDKYQKEFHTNLFLKGRLFSKSSPCCNWFHLSQFQTQVDQFDKFLLIPKRDWMFLNSISNQRSIHKNQVMDVLENELAKQKKALIYAQSDNKVQLSFVVLNQWPNLKQE